MHHGLIMELTLDETLQKAVEAHKAGQSQEADRLYTAILQALSFFKTAIVAKLNSDYVPLRLSILHKIFLLQVLILTGHLFFF